MKGLHETRCDGGKGALGGRLEGEHVGRVVISNQGHSRPQHLSKREGGEGGGRGSSI